MKKKMTPKQWNDWWKTISYTSNNVGERLYAKQKGRRNKNRVGRGT